MDGTRFDDLVRTLAQRRPEVGPRVSRRGVLGGLAGMMAGAASFRVGEASCGPDQLNRRGQCICKTTGRPPDADGLCPCANGLTRCGDACVDTDRDASHCGGCGASCTTGADVAEMTCRQGSCKVKTCAAGLANCDGDLVCETPLGTDTDCGACGDICAGTGASCGGGGAAGICGCADDGQTCGAAVCGTATNNCGDSVTCGPLGGACPPNLACQSGQCACTSASCPAGCCDGAGQCRIDDDTACGTGGGSCDVCDGIGETCGGGGTPGVCGCTPATCTAATCGQTIEDGCGATLVCDPCVRTFAYTGAPQSWTVPDGVTEAAFDLAGAQGGTGGFQSQQTAGGLGERTAAVLPVSEDSIVAIHVGGRGAGAIGGFNGGGAGHTGAPGFVGAGGGGASDIRIDGSELAHRQLVAGGGGGGGAGSFGGAGGHGGGTEGTNGGGGSSGGGVGAQSAGGEAGASSGGAATAGVEGQGGDGGRQAQGGGNPDGGGGGGGGGGYFGGGGGGGGMSGASSAGGGGGSGLVTGTQVAFETGVRAGHGQVTISYRFD